MNIYVVTSKDNLQKLQEKLVQKYKTLNIQGTNNLLEGIEMVMSRHVLEEYDLFLIIEPKFVEKDLASQKRISKKFNEGCAYILKDLPIYFLCKDNDKEIQTAIKQTLRGNNIRIYPYNKLQMDVIENVMKEVLVLTEQKKDDTHDVHNDVINAKKSKHENRLKNSIDRLFDERKKRDDEDFANIANIESIINQYSTNTKVIKNMDLENDKSAKILSDLKSQLFADIPNISDQPSTPINIKNLNHDILGEKISPKKLQQELLTSNQQYHDYANYQIILKDIINQIKQSDEPNKHEMIYTLMQEKAKTNTEMYSILSDFISEIIKSSVDFVTEEYQKDINELHDFGKMQDVDSLIGSEIESINELKEKREGMKIQVRHMIENLSGTTKIVNQCLSQTGKLYLTEHATIEKEIKEYANEHNLQLKETKLPNTSLVTNKLHTNYAEVKQATNNLIKSAEKTITHMMHLITTDEKIIEKQDGVIDTLMTQKTKKVIVVENLLQTKLSAVIGVDGVGKTHTAINMAYCHSKIHKTLLVDLNIYNPNLVYYNNTEDLNKKNRDWINNQTIPMEEFIRIPIGRYMHEQLPFKDNLTIIQPMDVIDLEEYERVVSPNVFAFHIKNFLNELAQFYDRIIVILPQDLSQFGDILSYVGTMYLVNDFNPNNFKRTKALTSKYDQYLRKIPIKHFIINKHNRTIKMSNKDVLEINSIDTREYKYSIVPEFKDSVQDKIEGIIPVTTNVNTRKIFDDVIKR